MNYSYSYTLLKEEESVNKLVGALKIGNKNINRFFYQLASALNVYIERKIMG